MKELIDYKNIRKIGLVARLNTDLSSEILILQNIFNKRGIELLLEKNCILSSNEINKKKLACLGFELDELFQSCDFIISLGGDGTLISLCRKANEYKKALLGIHAGRLGFLTGLVIQEAQGFFDEFFSGNFLVEEPFLLDLSLKDKRGNLLEKTAFNDVVFSRLQDYSMAHIEVFRGGKLFNEYYGDGLIVASAAGSTAYNLSVNGPIIYTLSEVFLLSPICAHSLTQRPIVLPRGFELEIKAKECSFFIDGREQLFAKDYASIKLSLSEKRARLIYPQNRDYFQILKEKLSWGN